MRAKHLRDNFQEIYKANIENEFTTLLKKGYFGATHSQFEPIKIATKTIKNYWKGIISGVQSNISNGILEGLNSVIQATKRKARGYRTFKNFAIMIYLTTGKLKLNNINKFYLPLIFYKEPIF